MQIKTTRYHFTDVQMASYQKRQAKNIGKDEEKRTLYGVSGNVNWYGNNENRKGVHHKIKN